MTIIPIFNDEAIYLDWGWRELHIPNSLYYSLFDGKQPLMMWVLGFSQELFNDPLLAGRLVSVGTGFVTLIGIYHLGNKYYSKWVGVLVSLLYITIPIFAFYDRQALMESAISMLMIWSLVLFLSLIENHSNIIIYIFGGLIGVGFFIKSTMAVFYLSFLCVFAIASTRSSLKSAIRNKTIRRDLFLGSLVALLVLLPLFFQAQFWSTLPMNSRFSYSLSELIRFPIMAWFLNIYKITVISFWHLTPFVYISSLLGLIWSYKKSVEKHNIISLYFLVTLILFTLLTKSPSPRYLIAFLPLTTIFAASWISNISKGKKVLGGLVMILVFLIPIFVTILQIFAPLQYFALLDRVTSFSGKSEYVTSWTSGYGIPETVTFLKDKKIPLIVGVRVDSGNPENAIITYFHNSKVIKTGYFDSKLISTDLSKIDCITFPSEFYFISRGPQLAGLDKFLVEVKRFNKPEGEEFVGIYTIKSPCNGKTLRMNEIL